MPFPSEPRSLRPDPSGPVDLTRLLPGADRPVRVTGVTLDSRTVRPGDLYVALPGTRAHGAAFTPDALAAGAAAVITDPGGRAQVEAAVAAAAAPVPVVVLPEPRGAVGDLAAEAYGRPATRLTMLGVTGTNGKTTTVHLLAAAAEAAGRRTGVVGTIGFSVGGDPLPVSRTTVTTPEAPDLQALLAVMVQRGADTVAMEVSSHALALGRVDGIVYDVAAFTNFGSDHLDFHGSLEAYFAAKASLFTAGRSRHAVISVDDPKGPELVAAVRARGAPVSTVSLTPGAADYTAHRAGGPDEGLLVRTPDSELRLRLALPGEFNARNALTALAMLDAVDVDLGRAAAGLATAVVPGRMQPVPLPDGAPRVFVDFAHTPQAVTAALRAARPSTARLVAVLGCGGDRDPGKREPMGAAAAATADLVVVTDDNPRTEDPLAIRRAVLRGAQRVGQGGHRPGDVLDGGDRRHAIALALQLAGPDDVVAVLGKGHETGQEIGDRVLPFDDAAVVAEEWNRHTSGAVR